MSPHRGVITRRSGCARGRDRRWHKSLDDLSALTSSDPRATGSRRRIDRRSWRLRHDSTSREHAPRLPVDSGNPFWRALSPWCVREVRAAVTCRPFALCRRNARTSRALRGAERERRREPHRCSRWRATPAAARGVATGVPKNGLLEDFHHPPPRVTKCHFPLKHIDGAHRDPSNPRAMVGART